MTFADFVHKHTLKNKATFKIKIQQVFHLWVPTILTYVYETDRFQVILEQSIYILRKERIGFAV